MNCWLFLMPKALPVLFWALGLFIGLWVAAWVADVLWPRQGSTNASSRFVHKQNSNGRQRNDQAN